MNNVEAIIANKKWSIDSETKGRLISLVKQFISDHTNQLELIDIVQFSSYFVTHVYKLVCRSGDDDVNFYAKFAYLPKGHEKRQRERIRYEYDYTVKVFNVFEKIKNFDSVKAVNFFENEGAFVMAEMPGCRFDEMLISCMKPFSKADTNELYQSMHAAGMWLSIFQKKMPIKGQKIFTSNQLQERIEIYFKKVESLDSKIISVNLKQKLVEQTRIVLSKFTKDDFMMSAKHNDFAPWNLMKSNRSIIGFDYADVEYDSVYYDVYHFTRALNTFKLKPVKKIEVIENCKQQFLAGFGLDIPLDHPTRIYFNIFFSLERVQMLLRAKIRNTGVVGKLKTLSHKRHMRWYLAELKRMSEL